MMFLRDGWVFVLDLVFGGDCEVVHEENQQKDQEDCMTVF